MSKRRELIIENASALFAKNGFEATSVQEITEACGISKGSFYLSFKSKESLLFSIFEFFSEKLLERVEGVFSEKLPPREQFEQSLLIYFEEVDKYSNFILMQIREQTNPINEKMLDVMNVHRMTTYRLQQRLLIDLYGEDVRKQIPDLITILGGIIKGYMEIIVFTKEPLNYQELARYLVKVVDAIVNGVDQTFLMTDWIVMGEEEKTSRSLDQLLQNIREAKQQFSETDDLFISLDVIEQELQNDTIRKPVIRGMLSTLEGSGEIGELAERLRDWLKE